MKDFRLIKSLMVENDNGVYRIRYRDINGIMGRIAPTDHPKFKTKEEAKEWVSRREAFIAGERVRIKKIKENSLKYGSLSEKIALFVESKRKNPGEMTNKKFKKTKEWKTIDSYFRIYVVTFFAQIKNADSPELWPPLYDEFFNFLDYAKGVRTKKPLGLETKRKICFWLNNFLHWLYEKNHTEYPIKLVQVPEEEDNELTLEKAYWFQEDLERVKPFLEEKYYDLLIFGTETGMRISELLSMRSALIRKGEIPDEKVHDLLAKNDLTYDHYLKLTSQLHSKDKTEFNLGPLKGKDKILDKYARYIPLSKTAFEIFKKYHNLNVMKGANLHENSVEKLFWGEVSIINFNSNLENAMKEAGLSVKTSHSMRHTAATNFLKTTGSELLTKMITGHESDKSFRRYNHLIQSIRDKENKVQGLL